MHDRLCLSWGWEDRPSGSVDQSPEMEHHMRRNECRLLKVYNKPEPEVTMETEAVSAGRLVGGCLSMEDVVDVRIYETCLKMQMGLHVPRVVQTLGTVARPKRRTSSDKQ